MHTHIHCATPQARSVFSLLLLCTMCAGGGGGSGGGSDGAGAAAARARGGSSGGGNGDGLDDVHIFIRKHLSHSADTNMRRIGIIGAIAFANHKVSAHSMLHVWLMPCARAFGVGPLSFPRMALAGVPPSTLQHGIAN
jgi:hypothetical protein